MAMKPEAWALRGDLSAAPEFWRDLDIVVPFWPEGALRPFVFTTFPMTFTKPDWEPFSGYVGTSKGVGMAGNASGVDQTISGYEHSGGLPARMQANAPTTTLMVGTFDGPSDGYYWAFSENNTDNGDKLRFRLDTSRPRIEAQGGFSIANKTLGDGLIHTVIVRSPGTSTTDVEFFVDGENTGIASSGAVSFVSGADHFNLFGAPDGSVAQRLPVDDTMLLFARWSRVLNDAEIKILFRDPFRYIRPREDL